MSDPVPCPNCARLQRRVDDLEIRLAVTQTKLAETQARLAETQARLVETQAKLAETQVELTRALRELKVLRVRTRQNSTNSSRPPSSDPPSIGPRRQSPTGRKPGGQPGHEGHQREPLPRDQMHEFRDVKPSRCGDCGTALLGSDPEPRRHQVGDLPECLVRWVEYVLHTLVCPRCGCRNAAQLPADVPLGMCAPRLQAFIAALTGAYRLSKQEAARLLIEWFGLTISPGTVSAIEKAVSEAMAASVEEARAYVARQGVAHVDETGWYVRHDRAWLWVAVTAFVTVFQVHANRSAKAAEQLLRTFRGVVVSDRYSTYRARGQRHRQLCWAHLIRDFEGFVAFGGSAAKLGKALLGEAKEIFALWGRVRDRTLSRSSFQTRLSRNRGAVGMLLDVGSRSRTDKVRAVCSDLLEWEGAMWTFARMPGVEPTNNAAERALRPGVLWRKGCFGSQSERGCRFVERIMTVTATLRKQGRSVAEFMTRACEAALRHTKPPSLLPSRAMLARVAA